MVGKCVRVSGRLVVSAAISWLLIPIANAEAPAAAEKQPEITNTSTSDAENNSAPSSNAPSNGAPSNGSLGEAPQKQLFTVPEDGMGDTKWLSGATRIVREITVKRSKEDLVICIAGCIGKQDRVVYAQPTEYVAPKPDATASETQGSGQKAAPAKAEVVKPGWRSLQHQLPRPTPSLADAKKIEFVPTMSKPDAAPTATDAARPDPVPPEDMPKSAQPK